MSNANTEHSKKLRQKTAAEWKKNLPKGTRFEIHNKDPEKIVAIKAGLKTVEGGNNTEKLLLLLDTYKKYKENN